MCSCSHLQAERKRTPKIYKRISPDVTRMHTILYPIFHTVPHSQSPPPLKRTINTRYSALTRRRWASAREKLSSHPNLTVPLRYKHQASHPPRLYGSPPGSKGK